MPLVHQAINIYNIYYHQKVQRAALANRVVGANRPNPSPSHSHSHSHSLSCAYSFPYPDSLLPSTYVHMCSIALAQIFAHTFSIVVRPRRHVTMPLVSPFLRLANSCICTSRRLRSRLSLASRKRQHPRKPAISFSTTHDSFEIICGLSEAI
jgi:hypothetical protein